MKPIDVFNVAVLSVTGGLAIGWTVARLRLAHYRRQARRLEEASVVAEAKFITELAHRVRNHPSITSKNPRYLAAAVSEQCERMKEMGL